MFWEKQESNNIPKPNFDIFEPLYAFHNIFTYHKVHVFFYILAKVVETINFGCKLLPATQNKYSASNNNINWSLKSLT